MEMAKSFQALSHPVRLKILEVLNEHEELNVGELHTLCDVDFGQSAMSQHLAVLRAVELVETRKESQRTYYQISRIRMLELIELLEGLTRPT